MAAQQPEKDQRPTLSEWLNDKPRFLGFAPPTSNTTYTPNQFFDVCLPHNSRGVVRLVAYLVRKTLGWCDGDGNPQEEHIAVSYQELIDRAGISREMIRAALDEATSGGFIECVREGRPKRFNEQSVTALFQLRWDSRNEYRKNPAEFRGFFEGEGNRTDIPNAFFDWVIPREPLSVIKVVGSVIRFSIGFQARHGRRRQQVALSYKEIQHYAKIADAKTLTQAIHHAIASNYIVLLEPGFFDPDAGRLSKAGVYAVRWADSFASRPIGQKNPAVVDRSEKPSGIGQKTKAGHQSENPSDIKIKQTNETFKQQQGSADAERTKALLIKEGFDRKTAGQLVENFPLAQIHNQIGWLAQRNPQRNKLGMLRRAIEENWPRPEKLGISQVFKTPGADFAAGYYAGYAGNRGQPLAQPSSREAAAGENFISRLNARTADAQRLGRAFGEMVREREGTTRTPSLILALRTYGDRFYVQFQQQTKTAAERESAVTREAHHRRFESDWIEFLRRSELQMTSKRPDDYAKFLSDREAKRRQIVTGRWQLNVQARLARFDIEAERLKHFQQFFGLPDFWAWDEQHNAERFRTQNA